MPPAAKPSAPLVLVCGDDEFAVKQRAKEIYHAWCIELGGMDHETIDAAVGNSGEALKALSKLREAINTLPFFGGAKVVWFQNCSFFGDDRTASSQVVTADLGELAQELKTFNWQNVRLLISAGKVDKRKTFYKTIDKAGTVESFTGWSVDDKDWADQAEMFARRNLRELKKEIADTALSELVANIGPNARLLSSEVEKLSLFVGDRSRITSEDVATISTKNKQARAFALGDAFGNRNLPVLLRCLDEELWEAKHDRDKSEMRVLYGLISKVRVLVVLKELVDAGYLKTSAAGNYAAFKAQLEKLPTDLLPADKKFNPMVMHPYVLFQAFSQVKNYSREELIRAMELLLECNMQFISTGTDEAVVLQQALVKIVGSRGK
ncbi:MAG: DNA polymerase III subunit delta [Verrucomicrobia bacterium]|nr:DNA polymerase III subunit delta [Verrucomicrobiota bacterium]